MKKLLTIIFTLLILLAGIHPAVFADNTETENGNTGDETESWPYYEYFEEGSTDVMAFFDLSTIGQFGSWSFEYNDRWFKQSADEYNHKLARLTFGLAWSAFRPHFDIASEDDPAQHLKFFLEQMGFTDQRMDDYDKNPSLYTVSTVMGHKTIEDEENGDFELLVIGICGGGYTNEWLSNFSIGDEELHVGFNSAASEVFDRVFGYIAQQHLSGKKLKIWFGGFSRAAAISNILATKLIDSKQFKHEDVFTYTFATPRTTKNPKPGQYPNIYNIVGKMDPVPNVPFADWGYERFGTTLYTPAQQTDSNYSYTSMNANRVYKDLVGIDFWNNVEMDTKLRVILNYLLKIAPTSKVYKEHIQDKLISMWSNRTVSNVMTTLMEIAGDTELINNNNQSQANSLLTYLAYSAAGYVAGSDLESKYMSNNATMVGNLAHEHTPEVYLAWLYSDEDTSMIYSNKLNYMRLVVSGDVDVAVMYYLDGDLLKCVDANGVSRDTFTYDGKTYTHDEGWRPDIFVERTNGETIVLLPKDADFKVVIKSNKDQTVSLHGIKLVVGHTNGSFSKLYKFELKKGHYDVVYSSNGDTEINSEGYYGIVNGDTFDVSTISKGDTTSFAIDLERSNILNLSWRQIVILVFTIPTLIISLLSLSITWLVGKHRLKRKIRAGQLRSNATYDRIPSACMVLCMELFGIQELAYWLMPTYLFQRSILKFIIGAVAIYLGYRGYKKQPTMLSRAILISLVFCTAADLAINYNLIGALALYGTAELVLIYHFYKFEKPEKWQWAAWGFASVSTCIFIWANSSIGTGKIIMMMAYAVIMMALLSLSLTKPKKIRFGAIFLAMSNVLIFLNLAFGATLIGHVIGLGVYYVAIMCFASSTKYKKPFENEEVDTVDVAKAMI